MEGTSHYAQRFAKCIIVREDDFSKNGSAGPHGDKKKQETSKLKDHHMSHGI